jgi:hypothetical protein
MPESFLTIIAVLLGRRAKNWVKTSGEPAISAARVGVVLPLAVSSRKICYSVKLLILVNKDIQWIQYNTVTTFQIMCGNVWSLVFRAGKVPGAARRGITGNSSTLCSGFCAQERLGGICRRCMATGRIRTGVFAVGGTRVSGSHCWNA